jgi:DNA end-binding protein Ku
MAKKNRFAIAQIVFSGREELVLIRPIQRLLAMTVLNYDNQVKKPSSFEDEVKSVKVSDQELKLAETLIEASTAEDFDFSQYKDNYTETLTKLIEAKAAGQKIVTPRKEEEPAVINLMDALRKSLARTGRKGKKEVHNGHVNRLHRVHRNGRKKKTG